MYRQSPTQNWCQAAREASCNNAADALTVMILEIFVFLPGMWLTGDIWLGPLLITHSRTVPLDFVCKKTMYALLRSHNSILLSRRERFDAGLGEKAGLLTRTLFFTSHHFLC